MKGDIKNTDAVQEAMRLHNAEAVLHFAASSDVGESVKNPEKYYENNVIGTLSLLKAMLATGCRKLVFSSSCSIYGQPNEVPIRETAPFNPLSPYGASKAIGERILSDYAHAYDLRSIALTIFQRQWC